MRQIIRLIHDPAAPSRIKGDIALKRTVTSGMVTIDVATAFNLRLDSGETLRFEKGSHEVNAEIAAHWYTAPHLVGYVPPKGHGGTRPAPPESVLPITAAEAQELLGPFLKAPQEVWERAALVLNELRLRAAVPYFLARRDAKALYAVVQALRLVDEMVERVAAAAAAFTVADLSIEGSTEQKGVARARAPRDLAAAIRVVEVLRHDQVVQGRDAIAAFLPVLDLRTDTWGTQWEAAAHAVWITAVELFTKLNLPTGRHAEFPFIQFIVTALNRLGFAGLSESTLLRWSHRHADKFAQRCPQA